MDDGRQRNLEEVGQLFGVTRERIRQIEAKALKNFAIQTEVKNLKNTSNPSFLTNHKYQ